MCVCCRKGVHSPDHWMSCVLRPQLGHLPLQKHSDQESTIQRLKQLVQQQRFRNQQGRFNNYDSYRFINQGIPIQKPHGPLQKPKQLIQKPSQMIQKPTESHGWKPWPG